MLVTQIEVLMMIDILRARIVEDRSEISGRHHFVPRAVKTLQREAFVAHRPNNVLKIFVVRPAGHAVIRRGVVELRKKQRRTFAVVKRARNREIDIPKARSIAGTPLIRLVARIRKGKLGSFQFGTFPCDDVDDRKKKRRLRKAKNSALE